MTENTFVREVKKHNMTNPLDILNWYRNLYHCEDNHIEQGIMANAINDLFVTYKDVMSIIRCKNCKYGESLDRTKPPFKYYKDGCVICTCEDVVGDEPMVYLPDHFCSYGEEK